MAGPKVSFIQRCSYNGPHYYRVRPTWSKAIIASYINCCMLIVLTGSVIGSSWSMIASRGSAETRQLWDMGTPIIAFCGSVEAHPWQCDKKPGSEVPYKILLQRLLQPCINHACVQDTVNNFVLLVSSDSLVSTMLVVFKTQQCMMLASMTYSDNQAFSQNLVSTMLFFQTTDNQARFQDKVYNIATVCKLLSTCYTRCIWYLATFHSQDQTGIVHNQSLNQTTITFLP